MKKIFLTSAIVLGLFALTAPAQSAIISYDLDFEFSGGSEPAGTPPWVTVNFNDFDTPGSVDLTISTNGLVSTEIVNSFYINFDPSLDLGQLVFTPNAGNTAVANSISTGTNAFQADGDGQFDILFDYPPPPGNGATLFGANETIVYSITSSEAITASSFDFFSAPGGGNGSFHAAAHILRIGENGQSSGWIGDGGAPPVVPEPATMLLFGIGTAGFAAFSRRRKK